MNFAKLFPLPSSHHGSNNSSNGLSSSFTKKKSHSFHSKTHTHSISNASNAVELSIDVESPPCVLYGTNTDSTGSLFNAIFKMRVKRLIETESRLHRSSNNDNIQLENIQLSNLNLKLYQKIVYNDNSKHNCKNCKFKITLLKEWDFVSGSIDIPLGVYSFPISYLFKGNLPATSNINSKISIKYEILAKAKFKDTRDPNAKISDEFSNIQLILPIPLTRSLFNGPEKNSKRVFPPTDLTVNAVLPNVIYPKSQFPVELKLNNITSKKNNKRRWRMRKLNWSIVEKTKIRCYSCKNHANDLKVLQQQIKNNHPPNLTHSANSKIKYSISTEQNNNPLNNARDEEYEDPGHFSFIHPNDSQRRQQVEEQQQEVLQEQIQQELSNSATNVFIEESRVLIKQSMKTGWKTDFENDNIQLVLNINCLETNSGVSNPVTRVTSSSPFHYHAFQKANMTCDINDPIAGIYTTHLLSIEVVVAEEEFDKSINKATPTGAARVLKMQFTLNFTEREGLGISWDDEVPPTYTNVDKTLPPSYCDIIDRHTHPSISCSFENRDVNNNTLLKPISMIHKNMIPLEGTFSNDLLNVASYEQHMPDNNESDNDSIDSSHTLSVLGENPVFTTIQGNIPDRSNSNPRHYINNSIRIPDSSDVANTNRITQ